MYFPDSRRPSRSLICQTSMAGTSRIDELRKKFDENPRRYFAPLANEYRKIGDFEQAIFICQEFLPQQPGHMSGHIVYGQALFESGRHDEARSVFETALALDPENLIALRHLGDIARARGDTETASAWYRRVLESDPRNDEIAAILTSLDSDVPSSAAASASGVPAAGDERQAVADAPLSVESAISAATGSDQPSASADPIVTEPLTSAPAESSFDDIAKLFTSAAPSAPAPAAPQPSAGEDKLDLIHEGEDVLGGTHGRPEEPPLLSVAEQPRAAEAPAADAGATSAAEAPPPSFNLPFLEGLTSPEAAAAPPPAPEPPRAAEVDATPARVSTPDASTAFVTETMAELYVKQGHHEQAIEVYRQLVQLHPNDSGLAARLRALEDSGKTVEQPKAPTTQAREAVAEAGPTIREFLASIVGIRPQSAAESNNGNIASADNVVPVIPNETRAPANDARTVGGSLNELFAGAEQGVPRQQPVPVADVGEKAPAASEDSASSDTKPLSGRPSKPAATELSLDHVFRHATPAAGNSAHSSFSFDQFFSEQAQQDVTASEGEGKHEESGGLGDDIQQFNAWLEGLKKS